MSDPVEAARVLEVEWLNGNVTDGAHDRIEAAIRADVVPTGDAGLDAAAREVCRLWFDLAGPENRSATYAALVDDPDDAFSEAMWTLRARLSSSDTGHDHHDECDCGLPPSSDTGGRG